MTLPKDLLDKLACPRCRTPLALEDGGAALACERCDLVYDVRDGIPDLLPDHGRPRAPARPSPERSERAP